VTEPQLILVAGALLSAGVLASQLAGRVSMPALVLLLATGMALGSDGLGWLHFADYDLARLIGVLALALILFEAGLATGWTQLRPVLGPALGLAVVGTIVTAIVTGLAATVLLDLSTLEGLLLGSILAATDGAAVFALLQGSSLRRRLALTLEGEAGFNDPVAVFLVIGFIEWLKHSDYGLADLLLLFVREMGIGALAGIAVGWLAVQVLKRSRLDTPGLYPVASLSTLMVGYGAAATLHGSGFLAAYLAGLALGSARIPAKRTVITFHQGLAWVAQLAMFLILGLLVFPGQLGGVALEATLLALVLVFVARPLAVYVGTLGAGFRQAERLLLGWAGLRGAVPVVLATFAVLAHVPHSLEFFNVVFFAVLLSTILQGTTVEPLARRLGLVEAQPAHGVKPSPVAEAGALPELGADVVEYTVGDADPIAGRPIRELDLPRAALVSLVIRGDQAIPPRGSTRLLAGDHLHVVVRRSVAAEVDELFARWRDAAGDGGSAARERDAQAELLDAG
jgi:cell volume regulation protein A